VQTAQRVLEVGCGTGAVLRDQPAAEGRSGETLPLLYGIDVSAEALAECGINAPSALLARSNAEALPYPDAVFDLTYCHFLLLWLKDPLSGLREMKRVTRGHVLAFAEPDYSARIDQPDELAPLGRLQTHALRAKGADISLGSHLADLFTQAGIRIRETGIIQPWSQTPVAATDPEAEWNILQQDVDGTVSEVDLEGYRLLDARARAAGERMLYVPTYFAWGQV
jgi:SAM-dependent methyltransferase